MKTEELNKLLDAFGCACVVYEHAPGEAALQRMAELQAARTAVLEAINPPALAASIDLRSAVEDFLYAYKAKYRNPASSVMRSNAPMRAEVTLLNAAYFAPAQQATPAGGVTEQPTEELKNGRRDQLRPAVHGGVPMGVHSDRSLSREQVPSLTDKLWDCADVMSLNAELGLTMDQLVRLVHVVLPLIAATRAPVTDPAATPPQQATPARRPLTDVWIEGLRSEANRGYNIEREDYLKAFRDAEAAHGIVNPTPLPGTP